MCVSHTMLDLKLAAGCTGLPSFSDECFIACSILRVYALLINLCLVPSFSVPCLVMN